MSSEPGMQPVVQTSPEEVREYIKSHREGDYTLLDVRQDWEYEEFHIPGARLVPLPELAERIRELNPSKPTFVYCAQGARSQAASQMLATEGFRDVRNIRGGGMAWRGATATGPESLGIYLLRGDENAEEVVRLAYRMESNLEDFYQSLAARKDLRHVSQLLSRLAGFEAGHQQKLFGIYQTMNLDARTPADIERDSHTDEIEGGLDATSFIRDNEALLSSAKGVVELAMSVEAQAQDLYTRYGRKAEKEDVRKLLMDLAEDEKAHLSELGALMDSKASLS